MTFREMNLNVFAGKPNPHVLFQPRMEPWLEWHRIFNTIPKAAQGRTIRQLYEELGQSMRYMHYYTGQPDPLEWEVSPEVKEEYSADKENGMRVTRTPYGDLVDRTKLTVDKTWRTVEFMAKTPEDLKKLTWVMKRTKIHFNPAKWQQGSDYIGGLGEPQFWVPKSPFQALAQSYMDLEDLIPAWYEEPAAVEECMEAIDETYESLYSEIIASGKPKIINFGENLHEAVINPGIFEAYYLPWYHKRSGQLRKAGIYTHIHVDGYWRRMLRYLKEMPFDGFEALTPKPQGDMTLEEIREYIGNAVLLDGIPAVLFMHYYPQKDLEECVKRIIDMFSPRLVLGISDELPEAADDEGLERVRWVAEYCRQCKPTLL
jgi:uroporphyrinogen-III decarboxylase